MRAHDVEELDGVVEILDLQADEALLPVPAPAGASRGEPFQAVGVMTW